MCWTLGRISKAAGYNLNGEDGKEEKEEHYFKNIKFLFGHFRIFYKNTQWQVYFRGSQTTWTRQAHGKFYLNLCLYISVFPSKKCSGTKKIQTRWNLIKLHPLSSLLYKNCILSSSLSKNSHLIQQMHRLTFKERSQKNFFGIRNEILINWVKLW